MTLQQALTHVSACRYHPDKNPAGREQFMAVNKAYERLQAGATGRQGPQAWRLLLLLKVCTTAGCLPRPYQMCLQASSELACAAGFLC